eukprot:TRINITY_DN23523_c0_g1_i2.p1 TRINITY_DN23523_c0_g1~~TRINITY_DN23523_c0_g1_i2.p1  ORF type:complete len:184 (-),score=36.65 TRINITY_DN23523_c0_g1_i2:418-969(-)
MGEAAPPTVFHCAGCRAVLGDSTRLVSAQNETITLRDVVSVTKATGDLETSRAGVDAGSTYEKLICSECETSVGKRYLTTPRALDDLREYYTLDLGMVTSYMLGSNGDDEEDKDDREEVNCVAMLDGKLIISQVPQLQVDTEELRENMVRVQQMIVFQDERLVNIEAHLQHLVDGRPTKKPKL